MLPIDRHEVIRLAARVVGGTPLWRGIDAVNRGRGGVILAYHEITPAALRMQLEQVARAYRFVPLGELVDRHEAGRSTAGLAVITFDDGPAEETEHAAKLAIERGWPMTFYLPTAYLDSGEPYWFAELGALIERAWGRGPRSVRGVELGLEPGSFLRDRELLGRLFYGLPAEEDVPGLLTDVRITLTGSAERPADLRTPPPIAWAKVAELARSEVVSFESHSVTHPMMSRVGEERLRREMTESARRIAEFTGRPVRHFCYPFGGRAHVGEQAARVAREIFRSAVTMERGRGGRRADRALLPRIPLYERDSRDEVRLKLAIAR
jgi:peptidoglycan/xylan/chitin deacetylase (PgdA/CDA1 family)